MTANLSLYGRCRPRNTWPVDRLKAFKSFLKALKAQAGVIHRGDLGLKSAPFQSLHAPLAARMAWGQCKGVSLLHGAGFALRASLAGNQGGGWSVAERRRLAPAEQAQRVSQASLAV